MKEDEQSLSVLDQPPAEFKGGMVPDGLIQRFIELRFKPHHPIDMASILDLGALGRESIVLWKWTVDWNSFRIARDQGKFGGASRIRVRSRKRCRRQDD